MPKSGFKTLKGCNSQCTLCMYCLSKVMLDPAETLVNNRKHDRVSRYDAKNTSSIVHMYMCGFEYG